MDQETFSKRMVELRMKKGVSARDMSLSIGQSAGYINNIENCVNYPSMATFFYICDYFGVTPREFFDIETPDPPKVKALVAAVSRLNSEQLDLLTAIANELK